LNDQINNDNDEIEIDPTKAPGPQCKIIV